MWGNGTFILNLKTKVFLYYKGMYFQECFDF